MTPDNLTRSMGTRARSLSLAFALSATFIASNATAQWPVNHNNPIILGTTAGARAMDILALEDGGAVATFETVVDDQYQVMAPRFNANGSIIQAGDAIHFLKPRSERLELTLYIYDNDWALFQVSSIIPRPHIGHTEIFTPGQVHNVDSAGTWKSSTNIFTGHHIYHKQTNGRVYFMTYDHEDDALILGGSWNQVPLDGTYPTEAHVVPTTSTSALACYIRNDKHPGVPSEAWLMSTHAPEPTPNQNIESFRVAQQPGVSQTNPHLTPLDDGDFMVTWLGEKNGQSDAYALQVNRIGEAGQHSPQLLQENVASYKTSPSPYGVPVHAFSQRDFNVSPPVDTLYAGLVDAPSGINLNLPFATGRDIDVKFLRQEPNGDFSIVYSVFESGTTLVKVMRISGQTAGILWNTTVADLGVVSSSHVKKYPNVAVDGHDNALFIMTRKDDGLPTRANFHLVRLRPDGQLGS